MSRLCILLCGLCAGFAALLLIACFKSDTPVRQEMYMVAGIFAFAAVGLFRLARHLRTGERGGKR